MPFDCPIDFFRDRRSRIQDCSSANRKWKIQCVSQSIGKEELGDGEAAIRFTDSENILRIEFGADDHVMMQMHASLWFACATRRIEPKCRSIRTDRLRLQMSRSSCHQLRENMC